MDSNVRIFNSFNYIRPRYNMDNCSEFSPLMSNSIFIPNYVHPSLDTVAPTMESTQPHASTESSISHSCHQYSHPHQHKTEKTKQNNYRHWTLWRTAKSYLLVSIVLFTLICFFIVKEKKEESIVLTIKDGEPKYINLTNELDLMSPVWTIKAKGPFIPSYLNNLTDFDVYFSIVKIENGYKKIVRPPWSIPVAPASLFQEIGTVKIEHSFNMRAMNGLEGYNIGDHYQLKIATTQDEPTPLTVTISTLTELTLQGILMACIVLAFLYFLIIFDIVQRTLAAMIGSTAAIACLTLINNRPSLEKVVSWLDIETLSLLFGMMVMVAILCETGFFDYVAVSAFRLAKGQIWPMIIILCIFTAFLSAFLDNVTTILLMTPVTIRLCEIKNLDPKYVLIAQVIFSNIGGAATPVGDPPNVIIIGSSKINSLGVNFTTFTLHMMPCILICIVVSFYLVRFLYKDVSKLTNNATQFVVGKMSLLEVVKNEDGMECINLGLRITESQKSDPITHHHYQENLHLTSPIYSQQQLKHVDPIVEECFTKNSVDLKREIDVWKKAYHSISGYSRDENSVRDVLKKKVMSLEKMMKKHSYEMKLDESDFESDLSQLSEKYKIRNKPLLVKSGLVMSSVILLFFLQTIPQLDLSLGWIAILGSIAILILADFEELESIFGRVEWSTLIFFGALFVVMEALSELKLLLFIGQLTQDAINSVSEEKRLIVAIMLILWVSALASSFIDNIPFATVMIKIIEDLVENDSFKIPMTPLVYALALGACLGGNGTLIGASANVVCAGVAEQHGYRFTFVDFFRVGFPVMLVTTAIANIYLIVCHVVFGWN